MRPADWYEERAMESIESASCAQSDSAFAWRMALAQVYATLALASVTEDGVEFARAQATR